MIQYNKGTDNHNLEENDDITGISKGFRFHVATEADFPAILDHIREHFSRDEITGKSLGYTDHLANSIALYTTDILELGKGLCLLATDPDTKEIAGVVISCILQPDVVKFENISRYDSKFIKIRAFLDHVDRQINLYDKYNIDEIFDVTMMSVNRNYRGRGLAPALVSRILRLAKKQKVRYVRATCTGLFSQKIFSKFDFNEVLEVRYDEYKRGGEIVFANTDPHPSAKLMVKKL